MGCGERHLPWSWYPLSFLSQMLMRSQQILSPTTLVILPLKITSISVFNVSEGSSYAPILNWFCGQANVTFLQQSATVARRWRLSKACLRITAPRPSSKPSKKNMVLCPIFHNISIILLTDDSMQWHHHPGSWYGRGDSASRWSSYQSHGVPHR